MKREAGISFLARLAALALMMLTTATAWASHEPDRCLDYCYGKTNAIHVQGWAFDPDASATSIDVHVYVYTDADCQNRYGEIHVINANVSRPDVNEAKGITGNHGFDADILIAAVGTYWVKVFAIDDTGGDGNPQIGSTQQVNVTDVIKEVDLSALTDNYVAQHGDKLTGTLPSNIQLSIANGAYVTLADANISTSQNWPGISCLGDAAINLVGENNIEQTSDLYSAIQPGGTGTTLTIQGSGSLTVSSESSAGIGTSNSINNNIISCGDIVINSGTITATSNGAAGIGCGTCSNNNKYSTCGNITINGGTITATGNTGAGIGSGYANTVCGNITINGGTVTAKGIHDSAGIGCGDARKYLNNQCGNITITGGNVFAQGFLDGHPEDAPGPGIGSSPTGGCRSGTKMCGNITISGGTVTAIGGKYLPGIGGGDNVNTSRILPDIISTCGDITISGGVVYATGGERAAAIGCGYTTVSSQVCGNITITDGITRLEATSGTNAVIGYSNATTQCGTLTVDGVVASPYNSLRYVTGDLPHLIVTEGLCWEIYPRNIGDIVLDESADNTENVRLLKGVTCSSVKLAGRTLYKDGYWNTLCLPFSLDNVAALRKTPLKDATIMRLDVINKYDDSGNIDNTNGTYQTGIFDGTLYLFFREIHNIPVGLPVIVKWDRPNDYVTYDGTNAATCSDIVDPTFNNISITTSPVISLTSADGKVSFVGNYSPISIAGEDRSILFLGAANTLYYPNAAMTVNAFRAYFTLNGITAGDPTSNVRAFVLNFGEDGEATGIRPTPSPSLNGGEWYDLQGRKLTGKPTKSGVYIVNGKKIVIK